MLTGYQPRSLMYGAGSKTAGLYREAMVPVEVHLYAQGSHAFNMGNRSKLITLKTWPHRMADWLNDNGWLTKK